MNFTSDQIGGVLRAILAAAGGYFVAKGTITADQLTTLTGLVGPILAAVWSIYSNRPAALAPKA